MEPKTPEAPKFDQLTVNFVTRHVEDMWPKAESLAAATEYTREHKQSEITKMAAEALAAAQKDHDEEQAKISQRLPELEKQARRQLAPPTTIDAVRLTYVKDTLHAGINELTQHDILSRWERAIDDADTTSAQVFYDHGKNLLRRIMTKEAKASGRQYDPDKLPMPDRYTRLMERTDDLLATPEQRTARVKVRELQETSKRLTMALNMTKARLTGVRLERDGLLDGMRAQMRKSVQF